MSKLEINGKELEGKCTFKFDRLADKEYNEEDAKGNKSGGFMSIYMNLLQRSHPKYLVAFWDCALAHLGKDKPSVNEIETAIEDLLDDDETSEKAYKDAFNMVDESGFFKIQAKNFWKNLEILKNTGTDDKDKAENLKMYNLMHEAKDALKG
jgi:hypothetical protein